MPCSIISYGSRNILIVCVERSTGVDGIAGFTEFVGTYGNNCLCRFWNTCCLSSYYYHGLYCASTVSFYVFSYSFIIPRNISTSFSSFILISVLRRPSTVTVNILAIVGDKV
jgi:hypothetical protein